MKVAFLQATLAIGGAERLVQSLMARMDRARIETVAVNLYGPGPVGEQLAASGQRVISGLVRGRWDPRAGRRLAHVLAAEGVELIYVPDSALPLYWAGWLRRRRARPALVLGFHSTGKQGDFLQHRIANASAFPVVDRFIALAGVHRSFLCRRFGLSEHRFSVIPSGVDTRRFHPAQDRRAAREQAGLPPDPPLAGIVAALRPEKDHSLFLRAASLVARRVSTARFVVVGDGPERARLEREARELGLAQTVLFLGARDDTPALCRALDVAVLSSRPVVETFPLTLLEAFASGVPVVSTDVGSIREIVGEAETGFLVPTGDAASLADRIARLLEAPDLRQTMGLAARRRAERLYAVETMVSSYERLFLEVAGGGGREA